MISAAASAVSAIPAKPDELTTAFLEEILRSAESGASVESFEWKALEKGVLSEVVSISVQVKDNARGAIVQREYVGKFLRPEFPFKSMFKVESNFYTKFAHEDQKEEAAAFPFAMPAAVFTSSVLIILERVSSVTTYSCVEGCPSGEISHLVERLARMHAQYWEYNGTGLAELAGIGSQLSGDEKRLQFPGCWASYLDDIPLDESDKQRLQAFCERLSAKPEQMARIHDAVAEGPSALIHGDFHVANMLFASDPSSDVTWLLDWATCGRGNPMRDLAFFFIVSVTSEDRRQHERVCLQLYHATMAALEQSALTLDDWTQQYRICVLNQFLILAVYDSLSKSLANNANNDKLRQELHAHFREVNYRACLCVLDNCLDLELSCS